MTEKDFCFQTSCMWALLRMQPCSFPQVFIETLLYAIQRRMVFWARLEFLACRGACNVTRKSLQYEKKLSYWMPPPGNSPLISFPFTGEGTKADTYCPFTSVRGLPLPLHERFPRVNEPSWTSTHGLMGSRALPCSSSLWPLTLLPTSSSLESLFLKLWQLPETTLFPFCSHSSNVPPHYLGT